MYLDVKRVKFLWELTLQSNPYLVIQEFIGELNTKIECLTYCVLEFYIKMVSVLCSPVHLSFVSFLVSLHLQEMLLIKTFRYACILTFQSKAELLD